MAVDGRHGVKRGDGAVLIGALGGGDSPRTGPRPPCVRWVWQWSCRPGPRGRPPAQTSGASVRRCMVRWRTMTFPASWRQTGGPAPGRADRRWQKLGCAEQLLAHGLHSPSKLAFTAWRTCSRVNSLPRNTNSSRAESDSIRVPMPMTFTAPLSIYRP